MIFLAGENKVKIKDDTIAYGNEYTCHSLPGFLNRWKGRKKGEKKKKKNEEIIIVTSSSKQKKLNAEANKLKKKKN